MNAQSGQIPRYPADLPTSLHTPAPRSWLRRNWLWLLAGLFAGGLLFAFGLFTLIFSAMRNSEVAKEAATMAQSNSAVVQRLGSPIEEGFFVSGSINVGEGTGDADLSVPVSGPKGKATVSVTAHKSAGMWNYSLMQVGIANTGERIDLLAGAPSTSENQSSVNQSQPANPPQPAQSAAVDAPAPQPTTVAANSPDPSASADPRPGSAAASPFFTKSDSLLGDNSDTLLHVVESVLGKQETEEPMAETSVPTK